MGDETCGLEHGHFFLLFGFAVHGVQVFRLEEKKGHSIVLNKSMAGMIIERRDDSPNERSHDEHSSMSWRKRFFALVYNT